MELGILKKGLLGVNPVKDKEGSKQCRAVKSLGIQLLGSKLQHLGASSPTRDISQAHCTGSMES